MSKKINHILIAIAILATLVTSLCTTWVFYDFYRKQVQSGLQINAMMLKDIGIFSEKEDVATVRENLKIEAEDLRVTWIDEDGTVLFDNDNNESQLENHSDRPEIIEAMKNGVGETIRNSDTMNRNTYYYAIRLENGTILRVAADARSIINMVLNIFLPILLILIGIAILSIFLARFLTELLMRPIKAITTQIEETGDLKLNREGVITVNTPDHYMDSAVYSELEPFMETIRVQHDRILTAAKSRQDFTANVSHELKTPLTAISGYAELIENKMCDEEQTCRFAGEIYRNSQRLLALINDILRLSELDSTDPSGQLEKGDLYQVVKSEVENLQINAQSRRVRLFFEGKPCIVRMNKDMIRELVDNLCQNAIRYNNPGGTVWVSVHSGYGHGVLTVADNGIGIPKDQQERIFERFYRVDKSRSKETGGTGLGLSIVKHIVEIHGAKIYLDSEQGKGTVIRVEF